MIDRYGKGISRKNAVVLIGHGTSTPANAMYSQIDYILTADGAPEFHVATVEGYPTYETTLSKLKASKVKNVTLVPFMFVAGDHARNDIDVEWRENSKEKALRYPLHWMVSEAFRVFRISTSGISGKRSNPLCLMLQARNLLT